MRQRGRKMTIEQSKIDKMIVEYKTTDISQQELCDKYSLSLSTFAYHWKKYKDKEMVSSGN